LTRLLLVTTGGTMAFDPRPGRGAFAPGTELLAALPAGSVPGEVTVEDMLAEPSWDLDPETMLRLARRARTAILTDGYDGVVITHGTDTLEETAFLTDLLAGPAAERAAIVLTGAMRPPTDLSADGPRNLLSSLVAAADPGLRGVGVLACLNDELHAAHWVTKVDATSVAAFSSAPYPVLGRVVADTVELLAPPPPRPPAPTGDPGVGGRADQDVPGDRPDPALLGGGRRCPRSRAGGHRHGECANQPARRYRRAHRMGHPGGYRLAVPYPGGAAGRAVQRRDPRRPGGRDQRPRPGAGEGARGADGRAR
jgi:L-asparaginase